MKNQVKTSYRNLFRCFVELKPYKVPALILMLAALPCIGWADTTWTGANSTDWTDSGNWNNGLPSSGNGAITIDQIGINTPTLSTSVSAGWDINIGNGGNTGALNQNSGTLATGNGNWGFIGVDAGSVGTYTLSGDAGFSAARINLGAFTSGSAGGTGTLNMDTTGTVAAYGNTANWWQANSWQIGSDFGSTGTINLTNGTVHSVYDMWLGAFSGTGILNQSGGTVNVDGNLALARMWNGSSGATVGTATITGGTLNAGSITGAFSGGGGDISHGTLTVSGSGVVNSEGDLVVAAGGTADSTGVVNVNSGGTVNVATTTKRWLQVNQWDSVQGTVNVNGGNLNLNANTDLRFSVNGGVGTSAVNLNSGTITSYSGNQTGAGSGVLAFNNGNAAGADNTVNHNGGILTISQIISGGSGGTRVFNFNGGTLKPTASSALFFASGVASAANVNAGGANIDTDGYDITIGQALLGTGVLTKLGAGTLTLNGTNSYTGNTVVKAGTLELAQATLASTSAVTISNAAVLQLDFATTNQVTGLVLDGVAQAAGVYNNANTATYITGTGSLLVPSPIASNSTNITFNVSGSTMALSWPSDHLGWILQQQTNSLNTGLGSNWVDVAGSSSVTSTNIAINPAVPTAFYRLRNP